MKQTLGFFVLVASVYAAPVFAGGGKMNDEKAPEPEEVEATVWVMAHDGSVKCGQEYAGGLPVETLEKATDRIREAKVKVFTSKKIQNPKTMMATVCGQPTREYNAIQIHKKDLKAALLQGFQLAPPDWIK